MSGMSGQVSNVSRGRMWLAGLFLLASLGLASPGPAGAQEGASTSEPTENQPSNRGDVGWLGIALIDCRGACTLTMDEDGANLEWFFPVEPRIAKLAPGSPAAQALRVGDRIVAIDGHLITTPEGGRRFANIEPGSTVVLRYRRDGRVTEATLRAASRRGPAVEGVQAFPPLLATTTPSDMASRPRELWAGPGILIQYRNTPEGRRNAITLPGPDRSRRATTPRLRKGNLGLNFACGPCSNSYGDEPERWTFGNPIDVIGVEAGGPSDRAGLRLGDRITHVNGARIDSKRGGEAFSTIRPGQAVQFTVIGRDGRKGSVTVVPD